MVFQDASRSLNPLMKVRAHLAEVLRRHVRDITRAEVERRSVEVLEQMRIGDAAPSLARAGEPIARAEGFPEHAASMEMRENPHP